MTVIETSVISERAYSIWEKEGRPDGKALSHWLQAEVELKGAARVPETPGFEPEGAETVQLATVAKRKTSNKRMTKKA